MTIDQPHAPTIACDGCRQLFTDDRDPSQPTPAETIDIHHWRGYDCIRVRLTVIPAWLTRRAPRGQALVEFALVVPVLLALLLAILEAGSFGARWIGYTHLADTITASAAQTGELPVWWTTEADRARCTDAAAAILPGAPRRVELRCTYQGIAVNGLAWPVTVDEALPD